MSALFDLGRELQLAELAKPGAVKRRAVCRRISDLKGRLALARAADVEGITRDIEIAEFTLARIDRERAHSEALAMALMRYEPEARPA